MAMDKKSKLKAIQTAIKQLEKTTKKEGIVQRLGDKKVTPVETVHTGSLLFDMALGGGLPKGRIIEFFGAESSGKTLCATRAMAEVQKLGGVAALIDMEHTFDPFFAAKLGLDTEELFLSQPEHMQDAFNVIDALIDAGVDIIVVDSVAALVPKEELEGEIGKQSIGLVARYMSQFLRRIIPKASKNGTIVIFINQIRDQVGVMYGDPTTTPGGRALKFYSSVRVQISRVSGSNITKKVGNDEVLVGYKIRANVKKNKVAPPFKKAEFTVYLDGRKVEPTDEIAEVAINMGLIPKYDAAGNISPTGRTYKFEVEDEVLIAKKKDDVAIELRKYPKIQAKLLEMIRDGVPEDARHETHEWDSDLSDEEFEEMIRREAEEIKNGNMSEAEEISTETDWTDI